MQTQSDKNAIRSNSGFKGLRKLLAVGAVTVAGFSVTALTPTTASAAFKPRPFNPGTPVSTCRTVAKFSISATIVANEAPVLKAFHLIAPGSFPTANATAAYGYSTTSVNRLDSASVAQVTLPVSSYNLFGTSSSEIQTLELRTHVDGPEQSVVSRFDIDLRSPVVQRTIWLGGSGFNTAQVTFITNQIEGASTKC